MEIDDIVLTFDPDAQCWVAESKEYDIVTSGKTPELAKKNLCSCVELWRLYKQPPPDMAYKS